jgi:hypothetical protein
MSSVFLNRTSQFGKRARYVGLVGIVAVVDAGLFGAVVGLVAHSKVSPQAIASSVIRTPEILERAWRLPVAATFNEQLVWQSNISRCGPASVANVYRSLGDTEAPAAACMAVFVLPDWPYTALSPCCEQGIRV